MNSLVPCLLYTQDDRLMQRISGFLHDLAPVRHIAQPAALELECRQRHPSVLILDLSADEGLRLLTQIRRALPDTLVIALGSLRSTPALEAEAQGVYAVEIRDIDRRRLQNLLRQANAHLYLSEENRTLREHQAERIPRGMGEQDARGAPAVGPSALRHIARVFRQVSHLDRMLATVVEGVADAVGVGRAGVFAACRRGDSYRMRAGVGCLPGTAELSVSPDDAFVQWLHIRAHAASRTGLIHIDSLSDRTVVRRWLDVLGAEVIVPLHGREQLLGWLFAGHRASGAPLDQNSLEGFLPLASDVAVILENALLHEEADAQKKLADAVLCVIPMGIAFVGSDGNVQWVNEAAERILQVSKKDAIGQSPLRLGSRLGDLLQQSLQGTPCEEPVKLTDPLTKLPLAVTVRRLMLNERCVGSVAIVQDLTRERLLRENQERADRAAFWAELAAAISHEVRNPLVAISTFAQLLPERYSDQEFREQFGQVAVSEIARLNKLIDQINEFANPPELEFKELSIGEVLKEAVNQVAGANPGERLPIQIQENGQVPAVWGDHSALVNCFYHILTNAMEAVSTAAEAAIQISAASARGENGQGTVTVRIQDNGNGIPPQMEDKIFSPFCTTKARGIGLGLPIVKRTVTDHNGHVDLRTGRKGTTVAVTLPAAGHRKGKNHEASHPGGG